MQFKAHLSVHTRFRYIKHLKWGKAVCDGPCPSILDTVNQEQTHKQGKKSKYLRHNSSAGKGGELPAQPRQHPGQQLQKEETCYDPCTDGSLSPGVAVGRRGSEEEGEAKRRVWGQAGSGMLCSVSDLCD